MAVEKTYEVVGSNKMLTRHMKFMVKVPQGDGHIIVPRSITLKGHIRPRRIKGRLITSEPALIEAIDQRIVNAGNKTGIICLSEKQIDDSLADKTPDVVQTKTGENRFINEVQATEIEGNPDKPDADTGDTSPADQPPPPPVITQKKEVPGISRVQDAKEWLLKNIDGLKTRDVTNKDQITRVASDNNIIFVDLL